MLVRDWMTHEVITASPATSVLNARRLLHLRGIHHLPVVRDGQVVGIVSDQDVDVTDSALRRSLSSLQSNPVTGRYRRVAAVMTAPVHSISPKATTAVAAQLMVARRVGALPVMDGDTLVGIISLSDCVRALLSSQALGDGSRDRVSPGDVDAIVPVIAPMGEGDDRPGRPAPRPVAVVVNSDAPSRLRTRNDLTALGYRVTTCPGPDGGTFCAGVRGGILPCGRVPKDTSLVVLDRDRSALAAYYERLLPTARISVGVPGDLIRSGGPSGEI